MEEKTFDYMAESERTNPNTFYGEKVRLMYFIKTMEQAIEVVSKLDQIKKGLFYGRKVSNPINTFSNATCKSIPKNAACEESKAIDLIHGILGKVTESGELLEALYKVICEGKEFDEVNLLEEVGDGLWYDALILRAIHSNFGEAQQVNIAKLYKRFPEKFTEYNANNRNLSEERKVLEKKS